MALGTTIRWAQELDLPYLPQLFGDHQLLQVRGVAEKEFYDWVLDQKFPVHTFRLCVGDDEGCVTTVAFSPVGWPSIVPQIDSAMMMIKLNWSSRPDVDWQARGYTKCKIFQK